jgi:hypothetical protein
MLFECSCAARTRVIVKFQQTLSLYLYKKATAVLLLLWKVGSPSVDGIKSFLLEVRNVLDVNVGWYWISCHHQVCVNWTLQFYSSWNSWVAAGYSSTWNGVTILYVSVCLLLGTLEYFLVILSWKIWSTVLVWENCNGKHTEDAPNSQKMCKL